jgi:hypothetical protein
LSATVAVLSAVWYCTVTGRSMGADMPTRKASAFEPLLPSGAAAPSIDKRPSSFRIVPSAVPWRIATPAGLESTTANDSSGS